MSYEFSINYRNVDFVAAVAPIKIFISYARYDDTLPDECEKRAKGFVTRLYEELDWEFTSKGPPKPELWRDLRKIDPANQFDEKIAKAISDSSLFLVILSRNWLSRPWCREELDRFARRWRGEGENGIKKRIVVVAKNFVEQDDIPELLRGQEGYKFFSRNEGDAPGQEVEFYYRGIPQDTESYENQISALATFLWIEAKSLQQPATAPPKSEAETLNRRRAVYLARPAKDMLRDYCRVAEELRRRNFDVLPLDDIPNDDSAEKFVQDALAEAELSVHLLGESPGYKPEGSDHIVELQLAQAAKRASAGPQAGRPERQFCRMIWAPRKVDSRTGAKPIEGRDPFKVVEKFGTQLSSDKVEGDNISVFLDFLLDHLRRTDPIRRIAARPEPGARIYLYYHQDDQDYVLDFAETLSRHRVNPVDRVFDGPRDEVDAHHRRALEHCDAVILIWGPKASEVWVRTQADGLGEWEQYRHGQPFLYRGLVAGPPPNRRKQSLIRLPPRQDIDIVLDLQAVEVLTPEILKPLVPSTA